MKGTLAAYLASDHDRLERLLDSATGDLGHLATGPYEEFRKGLLRHIGIEENIVLPAITRLRNGRSADDAGRLRLDHGALVALMVPPPDAAIILTLRSILAVHNLQEEGETGIYRLLEQVAGVEEDELLQKMTTAPEVRLLPHNARPEIREATQRALARAGYALLGKL